VLIDKALESQPPGGVPVGKLGVIVDNLGSSTAAEAGQKLSKDIPKNPPKYSQDGPPQTHKLSTVSLWITCRY
jgi:hypothetical protein